MQLGEYLGTHGTVLAFDKDPKRAALLEGRTNHQNFSNIHVFNQDFLTVKPSQPEFSRVRMILADPSCSGSGMLTNFERDSANQAIDSTTLQQY